MSVYRKVRVGGSRLQVAHSAGYKGTNLGVLEIADQPHNLIM